MTSSSATERGALFFLLVASVLSISVSIAASSIAFGAAVGVYLFLSVRDKFIRTPLDAAVIGYLLAEALSTVFSIDRPASFINMKRLFLTLLVPITLASIGDEKRFRTTLLLLFGSVSALSVFEVGSISAAGLGSERLGIFQHYMTAGGIKMFILLLMLPFIAESSTPRKWRILAGAAAIPILCALVLTETRSSWLGLISGIAAYALTRRRIVLVPLGATIVLFVLLAPAHWKERAFSIVDIHHYSNVDRLNRWVAGWRMFLDRPVVGTGDIDLGQIYSQYKEPTDQALGGHLHNNFLMILVTLGIVGACAGLYLFARILIVELRAAAATRGSWLYDNAATGSLAAYAGFHVNGLFEWNFGDHEIALLLWFSVGLALTAANLAASEKK